jgi:hypothetical protein
MPKAGNEAGGVKPPCHEVIQDPKVLLFVTKQSHVTPRVLNEPGGRASVFAWTGVAATATLAAMVLSGLLNATPVRTGANSSADPS